MVMELGIQQESKLFQERNKHRQLRQAFFVYIYIYIYIYI